MGVTAAERADLEASGTQTMPPASAARSRGLQDVPFWQCSARGGPKLSLDSA